MEIFTKLSFDEIKALSKSKYDKEHVTPLYRNRNLKKFKTDCFKNKKDLSDLRFTIDEYEDFLFLESVFNHFSPDIYFNWEEVVEIMNSNANIIKSNQNILRNEGSKKEVKAQNFGKKPKKLFLEVACCSLKEQKCFYQTYGQHIIQKQKVAKFGILIITIILTYP